MINLAKAETDSIPVRRPKIDFGNVSPYYIKGNALRTHITDSWNIAIPPGEQFHIRNVMEFKDRVKDPKLIDEIKHFCGQEIQHGVQTDAFINALESNGYKIKSWRNFLNWYFEKFTKIWPSIYRLSYTAGLEHLNAAFAHAAFANHIWDDAHPALRQLMTWHLLEEIEHKHVSFDVLKTVCPNKLSYLVRTLGYFWALVGSLLYAVYGCIELLRQDFKIGRLNFKKLKNHTIHYLKDGQNRKYWKDIFICLIKYLKPEFHPNQINDQPLLDRYRSEIQEFAKISS